MSGFLSTRRLISLIALTAALLSVPGGSPRPSAVANDTVRYVVVLA